MLEEDSQSFEQVDLDCAGLSIGDIGVRLRELESRVAVNLKDADASEPGFGAGLDLEMSMKLDGSVGDFGFMLSANSEWDVTGDAGLCCAHSLVSSRVMIRGSAGDHVGAFAQGGFVVVLGASGDFAGYGLAGAEILVRSTAGDNAGASMQDGVLVLANGAGENVGADMQGGSIFLRGDAKSMAKCVKFQRMKDADSMRLSLLMARAGLKGDAKEFKLYRPKSS